MSGIVVTADADVRFRLKGTTAKRGRGFACGTLLVDDPLRAERVVLVIAQPEELLEDVTVVLAQPWRAAELVRSLAVDQPWDAQRGGHPALQAFDLRGESARDQVWVAQDLGRLDTRRGGDAVRLQAFCRLLRAPRTSPVCNREIDGIVVSTRSARRSARSINAQSVIHALSDGTLSATHRSLPAAG